LFLLLLLPPNQGFCARRYAIDGNNSQTFNVNQNPSRSLCSARIVRVGVDVKQRKKVTRQKKEKKKKEKRARWKDSPAKKRSNRKTSGKPKTQ